MAKVLAESAAWQQGAVSGELLVCVHVVLEDVEGGVYEGDREREEGLGAVRVLACGHRHERVVQRGGQGHGAYLLALFGSRGGKICSDASNDEIDAGSKWNPATKVEAYSAVMRALFGSGHGFWDLGEKTGRPISRAGVVLCFIFCRAGAGGVTWAESAAGDEK